MGHTTPIGWVLSLVITVDNAKKTTWTEDVSEWVSQKADSESK